MKLRGDNCERVEIPYEGGHLSALYVRAEEAKDRSPLLVQVNGLDSTKEMRYLVGLPAWLARRGISSLLVDQPGTGEALRLHDIKARYDSEHWASRIVDWLETRPDGTPCASAVKAFRLAVTFVRALSPMKGGSHAASFGMRTTIGAMSRGAVWSARAVFLCLITGHMYVGYGVRRKSRRS